MQYFETALGAQGMMYAKWLLAFAVVLILAVVLLKLLRSLMGSSINMTERGSARGRVPRLGVTEFFNLDKQGRRLVIVRRDNIEHLVLIGGPNDVLIESNIVRADRSGAPRIEPRDTMAGLGKPESDSQPRLEPMPARQIAPSPVETALPPIAASESRPAPLPLGDRQPVVDIPREDLALRLEEVLRKPIPPRPQEAAPVAPPTPVQVTHPTPTPPPPRTPQFQPPPPRVSTPEPILRAAEPLRTPEPPRAIEPGVSEPFRPLEPPKPVTTEAPPPEQKPSENRSQDVIASILKPRAALTPLAPPAPPPPVEPPLAPLDAPKPVEAKKPIEDTKPVAEPPPPPPVVPPAPAVAPKNPFDSLEEEMARLLGRGLGDKQ